MSEATANAHSPVDRIGMRSVALPVEHGGWGMVGEPLLLGLLVAPSWAGLGVAAASLSAFLAHHPVKLVLSDWRRGATHRRTAVALGFVILYGSAAAAGLLVASAGQRGWWIPLIAAAPLAVAQLAYDARLQGRQLLPELLGAVALGSVVAAEMRAAGLPLAQSLAAWALLAAKSVGAVLYVRTRLRHDRGLVPNRAPALASHVGAFVLALVLARTGYAPWLAVPAFALLLARTTHGLSPLHRRVRPQAVGLQEMAYGFAVVLLLAIGYALDV
ncbi:MAG: YwiC-like family protein [Vicinamibacteria bacterium]